LSAIIPKRAAVKKQQETSKAPNLLIRLLDKAVEIEPRIRVVWGIVGIAAAAAIINFILGLNRLSFISAVAMIVGMVLIPVVYGIKSSSRAARLSSAAIVLMVALVFCGFLVTSLVAAVACVPRTFVFIYGLRDACTEQLAQRLRITNFTLFDETTRSGRGSNVSLTKLEPRRNMYFEIEEPDEFAIVIGFVVRGYAVRGHEIDLEAKIQGKGRDAEKTAWEESVKWYRLEEWKTRARTFKPEEMLKALGLKDGDGIPLVGIISCFDSRKLLDWSGEILLSAYDRYGQTWVQHDPIKLQLKMNRQKLLTGATLACS
jgi:hypothetical protein